MKNNKTNSQVNKITMEKVVEGLKFFAEHYAMPFEELKEELLQLGCDFTLQDVKDYINNHQSQCPSVFEGMYRGDLATGATVIANVMTSEFSQSYCIDRFLSVDDDYSVYHFIRVTTGDESYTKENVEATKSEKKHR